MARVGFLSMVNGNEDMINAVRGLSTAFAVKLKNQAINLSRRVPHSG